MPQTFIYLLFKLLGVIYNDSIPSECTDASVDDNYIWGIIGRSIEPRRVKSFDSKNSSEETHS